MLKYEIKTNFGKANTQVLKISKEIANLTDEKEVWFDFSTYGECNPFSNLLLVNALRHYKKENPNIKLMVKPKTGDTYLSHIGFYKTIGIDYGKEPGEANANTKYVPITPITFCDNFYQTIESKSEELASLIYYDNDLKAFLKYAFIETIRNVYEHSEAKGVYIAAQKWPMFNLLEIAIADSGCGISNSLGRKFGGTDLELLKLSCKPGITAGSNFSYLSPDDIWRNSGYGLYALKQLSLAYEGSFLLCSGSNAVMYSNGDFFETKEQSFCTQCFGTVIGIRISTNTANDFGKIRSSIIKAGQEEAKEIQNAIKKASRSSGGHYYIKI